MKHTNHGGIFLSILVLAETAWVLSQSYRLNRNTLYERFAQLIRTRGVTIEEFELVDQALEQYRNGAADLADYLIVGKAQNVGAISLLTFDKKLGREARVKLI